MTRTALKGLLARKLRTTLTALAVVFGVAMVSGTFVLTDTISKAFDSLFSTSYENAGAVISGRTIVKESSSGNATVPESLLAKARTAPGVAGAAGAIFDLNSTANTAKLIGKDGKVIATTGGAPNFGWGIDTSQPRLNPLRLVDGRWAAGPDQVVIDAATAENEHFRVGDRIRVSAQAPTRSFRISGLARFGDVKSLGGATFAVFQVPTAQALLDKRGRLDAIFLAARPGTTDAQLAASVRPLLPASAQVQTAAQRGAADAKDTKEGIRFVQYFLLAFAGIALLVGAFVIFNTLSMTVAQRVRELATLRTLGASRRQVLRSVLLEGLVTGLLASVVGLLLGLALAKGLAALFVALGLDLPRKGTALTARTIAVSLGVGTVVTVLATVSPARRATRVPAISAVREGATLPPSRLMSRGGRNGAGVLAAGAVLVAIGLFADGLATGLVLLTVGVGCILLFAGVGLAAPRAVPPLAALVGAAGERLGGAAGRLARENAVRNPSRTARTAGALMIGLALVTFVATLGSGLRSTIRGSLEQQVTADYVVTSKNGFDPFPAGAGTAAARAPGVTLASSVRGDRARAFGADVNVNGVDPATIGRVYDYRWTAGSDRSLAALGRDGAIVKRSFAEDHHLGLGSRVELTTPGGERAVLRVTGIHDPPTDEIDPVLGDVALSQRGFDARFERPRNLFTFVNVAGGTGAAATAALQRAVSPYPDAKVATDAAWVDVRAGGINKILAIFYVLLALSVLISLFGMVNALVLSVFERTRELGMMRAVGMTRAQVRRMVRHESVITALIGACLGLPLGVLLAMIVTRAMRSLDVAYSLPLPSLVVLAAVAGIAGVLAATLPARRASRLNVLRALHYE
ncbi:MAG TPA: FtsX-like permease family protein [Solirubrobacteraceae bacterium]|nr:FtsX-like permease family protein [Solirubrobacteraceae bacterium]